MIFYHSREACQKIKGDNSADGTTSKPPKTCFSVPIWDISGLRLLVIGLSRDEEIHPGHPGRLFECAYGQRNTYINDGIGTLEETHHTWKMTKVAWIACKSPSSDSFTKTIFNIKGGGAHQCHIGRAHNSWGHASLYHERKDGHYIVTCN